jgi:transposase-like protein
MLGFKSFLTAEKTLKGIEAMHMIRKGQAENGFKKGRIHLSISGPNSWTHLMIVV